MQYLLPVYLPMYGIVLMASISKMKQCEAKGFICIFIFLMIITVPLPVKAFDVIALINLVEWAQQKNYRAYLSHRKRKLAMLK
jgi:hypothetical protein